MTAWLPRVKKKPYGMVKSMNEACVKVAARDLRRQAIIDIARDIFLSGGYACASMSAIAARLGGSKGTLYNYFTSKEELFAAVIQDHCECKQAALFDGMELSSGDIARVLQGWGERYVQVVLADSSIILNRVVIAEATRFPELSQILYDAGPKRGMTRMTAYLQQEMKNDRLRQDDPLVAAQQLAELCLAGLYRLRLLNLAPAPEPQEIRTNVCHALDTFLARYGVSG